MERGSSVRFRRQETEVILRSVRRGKPSKTHHADASESNMATITVR